jgi:hypothetical protein
MSIEENTVLLVIDAMNGYVVIVVVAVVMKIPKIVTMMINKLTLKHTDRLFRVNSKTDNFDN